MTLRDQARYAGRHLFRGGMLSRARADWLSTHERDSASRIRDWQDLTLRAALQAAARRLPAYAFLGKELHADQDPISLLQQAVPIVDKTDLQRDRSRYYPGGGVRRLHWPAGLTSGTTGSPLEVFRSLDSVLWEQAFLYQHWRWAGHGPKQRQAVLRGALVVPLGQQQPAYWARDLLAGELLLSTRHLSAQTVGAMARAVRDFGARHLRAYPSSAYELARLVREQGIELRFDSVQTSSELLYPVQRELIEQVFGARVFDLYGMAERVALGMECEHGRMHMNPHYSHVEIVDEHGRATDGPGQLLGTTLLNRVMPLLRYRMSDSAQWDRAPCPCGRAYPVVRLSGGKLEDRLFDLDGLPVSPSVTTFAFKGVAGIERAQVAQVAREHWELRVVPGPGFGEQTERQLMDNFAQLVSARIRVSVRRCEQIPNLKSGKFKWLVQECPELMNAGQLRAEKNAGG